MFFRMSKKATQKIAPAAAKQRKLIDFTLKNSKSAQI